MKAFVSTIDIRPQAYILMIRALRDGYLLPADVDFEGSTYYTSNSAVIGDMVYWVYAWDDDYSFVSFIDPIPASALSID